MITWVLGLTMMHVVIHLLQWHIMLLEQGLEIILYLLNFPIALFNT